MQAISLSKQGHVKVDSKIRSRLIGLIWRESRVRRDKVNSQIAGLKGSTGNWICDQEMRFLPEFKLRRITRNAFIPTQECGAFCVGG